MRIPTAPLASIVILTLAFATMARSGDFLGVTSTTHFGDEGVKTFTDACNTTFTTAARMCMSTEILNTTPWPSLSAGFNWVRPVYQPLYATLALDAAGISGPMTMQCQGWSIQGDTGLTVDEKGRFGTQSCSLALPVACCDATPIPEPSAMLLQGSGIVGLLALAKVSGKVVN